MFNQKLVEFCTDIIALVDDAICAAQNKDTTVLSHRMREIDKIVYDIYGLTDAEIKIIEQSI